MLKLAKYLVPILHPLTTNKYTVKDLLNFGTEIVDSSNFMGSLGIDSLFINIPLEKTIEIWTNNIFKTTKSEFKELLSLANWYIDDILVLFKSSEHLKRFQSYLNSRHVNMPFTIETEEKTEQQNIILRCQCHS